jgi:hypothetical protein
MDHEKYTGKKVLKALAEFRFLHLGIHFDGTK